MYLIRYPGCVPCIITVNCHYSCDLPLIFMDAINITYTITIDYGIAKYSWENFCSTLEYRESLYSSANLFMLMISTYKYRNIKVNTTSQG